MLGPYEPYYDCQHFSRYTIVAGEPTIISCSFSLTPMRVTFWRYFRPDRMSCWTLNCAFMRNRAPSLMVKGFSFRASTAPGARRSITISSRPSTSRARERMIHRRGSLGSEMSLPCPRPRDFFHFWRDSSFWSVAVRVSYVYRRLAPRGDCGTHLAAGTRQWSSSRQP